MLPDGTKPLPEPMWTYHVWGPVTITWGQFHKRQLSHQQIRLASKRVIQNWNSDLPRANELNRYQYEIYGALTIYGIHTRLMLAETNINELFFTSNRTIWMLYVIGYHFWTQYRADSRFAPSQRETGFTDELFAFIKAIANMWAKNSCVNPMFINIYSIGVSVIFIAF